MKELNPASSPFTTFQAKIQTVGMLLFVHVKQSCFTGCEKKNHNYCSKFSLFY